MSVLDRVLAPLRRLAAILGGVGDGLRTLARGHTLQDRSVHTDAAGLVLHTQLYATGDLDERVTVSVEDPGAPRAVRRHRARVADAVAAHHAGLIAVAALPGVVTGVIALVWLTLEASRSELWAAIGAFGVLGRQLADEGMSAAWSALMPSVWTIVEGLGLPLLRGVVLAVVLRVLLRASSRWMARRVRREFGFGTGA